MRGKARRPTAGGSGGPGSVKGSSLSRRRGFGKVEVHTA